MTTIEVWGDALDYTLSTRHSWRHGNGRHTAIINAGHFTSAVGLSCPVRDITQSLIARVSIGFEESGKSDATINRIISAVSTVLNHCADDGLIPSPPKFRRRKESEGRVLYYTKDEVNQLINLSINVLQRDDLADITRFAAYHGLRQGEILKLRNKDIDWFSKRITVGGEADVITKAGNVRVIPIHASCLDMLQQRCSHSSANTCIFGDEWRDKDQLLRSFRKANNLLPKPDGYVFHTLRHSYATWLADAGVPVRSIMYLMGHKRIETTLRYAKATDSALVQAMESI